MRVGTEVYRIIANQPVSDEIEMDWRLPFPMVVSGSQLLGVILVVNI